MQDLARRQFILCLKKGHVDMGPMPCPKVDIKDERGIPDRQGFPDRTVQPRPDSGHGAIFCLNRGSVRSGVKKTGRVGNGVVFSRCGYDFSVRGKILIEMK